MVPKVQNAGDIAFVDRALGSLEQGLGLEVGRIGIEAQVEDAQGLTNAEQIASASPRLETITYGPADFSAAMHFPNLTVANSYSYPGDIFHYVLFKLAVAARAAGIQVVDGPYLAIRDIEGFRDAAGRSAALGYDGKWVLHPGQIEPCNEVFTPSQADFDKAVQILDAYRHATEVERKGAGGDARRRDDRRGVTQDGRAVRGTGPCGGADTVVARRDRGGGCGRIDARARAADGPRGGPRFCRVAPWRRVRAVARRSRPLIGSVRCAARPLPRAARRAAPPLNRVPTSAARAGRH